MKTGAGPGNEAERVLWLVDQPDITEVVTLFLSGELGLSFEARPFATPELALDALGRGEAPPDLLITAYYFDGRCKNGFWLVQEARALYPNLLIAVASGFPLEQLKSVADRCQVQPNLLLPKGKDSLDNWLPPLKELLAQHGGGPTPPRVQSAPAVLDAFMPERVPANQDKRFAVLHVNDEELAHKYFRLCCRDQFKVLTAATARQGFELLNEHSNEIGIILADRCMPSPSGLWLLRRARECHPHVVRILVSDGCNRAAEEAALRDGTAEGIIPIPWDPAELKDILRGQLERFAARRGGS